MDLVDLYNKRLLALAKKLDRKTIEPEDFEAEKAEVHSKIVTEVLARNAQRQRGRSSASTSGKSTVDFFDDLHNVLVGSMYRWDAFQCFL